jgi:hypothetical protein
MASRYGASASRSARVTAAFAYGKLMGKPMESGSFEQFLKEIFGAYEIEAPAASV